jgi:hypothetical protein
MKDSNIYEILNGYKPVSLHEIDNSLLLNRVDTKFVFSRARLPDILKKAKNHFRALEINNQHTFIYNTTYLDTSNYQFFYHHLCGKRNRKKIRYRVYESTGISYLEIKIKSNAMRTSKIRIKNSLANYIPDQKAVSFLSKNITSPVSELRAVLNNRFSRITLANLETNERVTIDYDISFSDLNGKTISLPYLAIAELKQERISNQSPLIQIVKSLKMQPSAFSKYCMGCVLIYNLPRNNVLKPQFLTLNKIKNDCSSKRNT